MSLFCYFLLKQKKENEASATEASRLHLNPRGWSQSGTATHWNLKLPPGPWNVWAAGLWLYQVVSHTHTHTHTQKAISSNANPTERLSLAARGSPRPVWDHNQWLTTPLQVPQNNHWGFLKVTNATWIWTAADINVDIFITWMASVLWSPVISALHESDHLGLKGLIANTE